MQKVRLAAFVVVAVGMLGCGGGNQEPYDENWGAEDTLGTAKADGLFDIARKIEFGETVTGTVGGDQVNVYKLQLQAGDRIKLVETVVDGDLNPHLTLFYGTSSYIGSQDWNRDGDVLTKSYRGEESGLYMVALRAYHGEGEGRYSLTVSCEGGPCNGEVDDPWRDLTLREISECIMKARRCAFERMAQYNGAVGEARAEKLMTECLEEATLEEEGFTCKTACSQELPDSSYQPSELCDDIKKGIIFYADQTEACLALLDDCMSQCYDQAEYYDYWDIDDLYATAEAICWDTGMNGTCDSFARDHEVCGGSDYGSDTIRECFEMCESTAGAWIDDLDTICSDTCDSECDGAREQCAENCPDDDGNCYYDCIEETAPECS